MHDKSGHLAFLDLKPVLFWGVEEQLEGLFRHWEGTDLFLTKDPHANICLLEYTVIKQKHLLHSPDIFAALFR